jgi:hypothetical protein
MLSARENYCPDQVTFSGAETSHPTTILAKEKALTLLSLVFQARIYLSEQLLIMLKLRKSRKVRNTCSSTNIMVYKDL